MGRISLTPLRVRTRAIADLKAGRIPTAPVWLDVLGDVPPSQILTRQQPVPHPLTETRTRSLPNGKTHQITSTKRVRKPKSARPSRLFAPVEIKYEEDELRRQFFQDHPWELARPRVVMETTGNQHKDSDYGKGLRQPGAGLSGESVVQRQLHLLENEPDISVPEAYDVARREFYNLRRQEATRLRVAKEEQAHMGAEHDRGVLQWSMAIENKYYNEWEEWSKNEIVTQMQRSAAFSGEIAAPGEEDVMQGNEQQARGASADPNDPFARQAARRSGILQHAQ